MRESAKGYENTEAKIHLGADSPLISKLHTNWRIHCLGVLDRKQDAERFLTTCGVREGDVALALHSMRRIAHEFDGAVLYVRIDRAGRYRHPQLHEDTITLSGVSRPVRQIAVRNIGRDEPTLLITDATTSAKDLFGRYAERMLIENELSAYIKGFHLDALSSGLALNVDVDATLTVIAGSLYRLLARSLNPYEHTTAERLYDHFIDTTGTLHISHDQVTIELTRRTWTPVLLQAGYAELDLPIPWWQGRRLRYRFS